MLTLSFCLTLLGGCAGTPQEYLHRNALAIINYKDRVKDRLARYFYHWEGTPYRRGGLSKKGIDCSGFVYVAYRDVFGIKVPRSTAGLADAGTAIPLDKIKTGDLLIFKTGVKQEHVGIYMGNGEFFHASSSRGVISSNIYSPYWSNVYQQSRRLLN